MPHRVVAPSANDDNGVSDVVIGVLLALAISLPVWVVLVLTLR